MTFSATEPDRGSPSHRVIQIHGELGLADIDRLQEVLDRTAPEHRVVVIGLEDCEFIDSIALAALLRARDRLAESERRLVIAAPTGQVLRVLEVSGLNLKGFLFGSVEEALGEPSAD
jgi:anti-anti-sigma factor